MENEQELESSDTQPASQGFEEVKKRLDEIVEAVADENISLDESLNLYEEAVKLGMQASSMLEEDITATEEVEEASEVFDEAVEEHQ